MFILVAVVGLFAGLNGIKTGFLGTAAAVFGLMLKGAMSVTWIYPALALLLLSVVCAAIASIVFKNRAVKELICGAQAVKDIHDTLNGANATRSELNQALCKKQTKPTRKLVEKVKSNLKLKGKI